MAKAKARDRDRFLKVVLNLKKVRGSARAELFFLDFFSFCKPRYQYSICYKHFA